MTAKLIFLLIIFVVLSSHYIHALRHRSIRQTVTDLCPNPNANTCLFISCENGGICIEDATTLDCFKCQCAPGYTGKICDTQITVLPNGCTPGCLNGGICNINVCVCQTGYTGTLCENRDFCLPSNPCQNGGRCISSATSYTCDCTGTGYTGAICTQVEQINSCIPNPCQNSGQCSSNGGAAICSCIGGYSGTFCQIPPIPCSSTPCENGGKCELIGTNTYGCVCPEDYSGDRCQTYVLEKHPCVTMPATVCQNNGVCTVNGASYLCKCAPGWTGTNCEIKETISTCDPNPCGFHGTCIPVVAPSGPIAYCNCEDRWTGRFCDVNIDVNCPIGYCLSGGTCRLMGSTPYCECPVMYTGQRCETFVGGMVTTTTMRSSTIVSGVCSPSPCLNGGICIDKMSNFECMCQAPWSGLVCNLYEGVTNPSTTTVSAACVSQPCRNGGTCFPVGNTYACFCGTNSIYTGKNCDSTTPMTPDECPLDCAPGRCIFSGNSMKPYACLWNGVMRPIDGTTG